MFDWLLDPSHLAALVSLAALEIVLGIDNVVFLSLITAKLKGEKARQARQLGLMMALVFRIALLFAIAWIIGLTQPVFSSTLPWLSWRDVILIGGGLFLIVKATQEMHSEIEGEGGRHEAAPAATFYGIIGQIALIDVIFSLDSIITAVGMAQHIGVMIAAVVIAVAVMYFASEPVSRFIERHPTSKMLALSFLLLVGVALVADGFGHHIDRGYIYFAMGFAVAVEAFNIMVARRRAAQKQWAAAAIDAAKQAKKAGVPKTPAKNGGKPAANPQASDKPAAGKIQKTAQKAARRRRG